jgi:predicted nucleic acid-binding protein
VTRSTSLVVLDASVVLRAFVDRTAEARAWLRRVGRGDLHAFWPDLVYLEVANALTTLVRARMLASERAAILLEATRALPVEIEAVDGLAPAALGLALARGLSVYDAAYVALAEASEAVLVTADRVLAAATPGAVLIR